MAQKVLHTLEVVGLAALVKGTAVLAQTVGDATVSDITAEGWWVSTGLAVAAATWAAARKALGQQLLKEAASEITLPK